MPSDDELRQFMDREHENDDTLEDLIELACQRSANDGIQLTTYYLGFSKVQWIDRETDDMCDANGVSVRDALLNMLVETRET